MTDDAISWPHDGSESGPGGSPDGGEHDDTPDEGGTQDQTPNRRITPSTGGDGDDDPSDADDDELITGHAVATRDDEGPVLWQFPCWYVMGMSHHDLLGIESMGPEPSLTACGNHFHADMADMRFPPWS